MKFLDFEDYQIGNDLWKVNKDRTVLVHFTGFQLLRAWGIGNIASPIDHVPCYTLKNIYVRPDVRGKGLFTSYMDQIYCYFIFHNIPLFLFPAPFSFDICPFSNPKKADIKPDYLQDRKKLYEKYTSLGFTPIKSAYYNPDESHRTKIINTTISGDPDNRKAIENEIFAPVTQKGNFGYCWLGIPNNPHLPPELYQPECRPIQYNCRAIKS